MQLPMIMNKKIEKLIKVVAKYEIEIRNTRMKESNTDEIKFSNSIEKVVLCMFSFREQWLTVCIPSYSIVSPFSQSVL